MALLEHDDNAIKAAMAGVLMNVTATSLACRAELSVTGLLPQLLRAISTSVPEAGAAEPEVRKNALGALNNLMLDETAARALRTEGGIEVLTTLLEAADSSEARLEDAQARVHLPAVKVLA